MEIDSGVLITAAAAVVGAIVGALVAGFMGWNSAKKSLRLNTTISLLNEWHSGEMRQWRATAEKALKLSDKGFDHTFSNADSETQHALSNVAHYLEKFELLWRYKYIENKLVQNSMGVFSYWSDLILGSVDLKNYEGEWVHLFKNIHSVRMRLNPRMLNPRRLSGLTDRSERFGFRVKFIDLMRRVVGLFNEADQRQVRQPPSINYSFWAPSDIILMNHHLRRSPKPLNLQN